MSPRTGELQLIVPKGVDFMCDNSSSKVTVKGPLGEISSCFLRDVNVYVNGNSVFISISKTPSNVGKIGALMGLYLKLFSNFIKGVSSGFEKILEIVGVGYKVSLINKEINKYSMRFLILELGFSHKIYFLLPDEVICNIEECKGKNTLIKLKSFDKQLLGQVAAVIRAFRPPECYNGKGVRYYNEYVRMKVGKQTSSSKAKK